jgi:transposase-like protein
VGCAAGRFPVGFGTPWGPNCTATKVLAIWDDGQKDALAMRASLEAVRVRLQTTNNVEKLNAEIRRR